MVGDRLRTGAHAVGLGLVAVAVVLAVLMAAPGLVGAEGSFVVKSDSMSPAISAGDVVVVQSVEPESLQKGDVITFESENGGERQRVTHRIVSVENSDGVRQFRTKGDANEEPDQELVESSDVIGKVWFTIPLVGHLFVFAGTDVGLVVFVVLPAVVLVVTEVYSLYTEATTEENTGREEKLK